mgnify:CR=1 FL=1|tara:strand:- start:7424 stop:7930 length:507 start_codon:yes stop_codon:yes gene_type:complete
MATINQAYGTYVALAVTALQSLASSQTVGWKSVLVDLQTSVKPLDVEFFVKLTAANTAPANDKAMYVWLCPAMTTDGGSTWLYSDGGTTTLPTSADATYTIALPNNLKLLGVLNYTTQQMVCQGSFLLSNAYGASMPDGFLIIITNYSGAALSTSCVVAYRPITQTVA